jgi:hypothetical protein
MAHRELDDALATAFVAELLTDGRTGKNPARTHPRLLVAMGSAHHKSEQERSKNRFHRQFGTDVRVRGNKRAPGSISPPANPARA